MSNATDAGRGSKSNYGMRPIEDYALFAIDQTLFCNYTIETEKIINAYHNIYDIVFESNMSITKKVKLFKLLTMNLYTNYPAVIYTNVDNEISKIVRVLKRSIHRKHYR